MQILTVLHNLQRQHGIPPWQMRLEFLWILGESPVCLSELVLIGLRFNIATPIQNQVCEERFMR